MSRVLTAGVDIGSSAIKVVIMASERGSGRERAGAELLAAQAERLRRRDPLAVAQRAFERALEEASAKQTELAYVATTGEGERFEHATGHFYGMTTHARGAIFIEPRARAALDVGALHARAFRFDDRAKVEEYRMTSQCASGSGQFLENIARYLGVTVDEVGELSLKADNPEKVSSICAVLAETDVINLASRGISIPNVLRGIHESMAGRYVRLLRKIDAHEVVLVTGGLSADTGLLAAIRDGAKAAKLGAEIVTSERGVYAGAIGAALWGAFRSERLADLTSAASAQPG